MVKMQLASLIAAAGVLACSEQTVEPRPAFDRHPAGYTMVELGSLGNSSGWGQANGVNASGQVVGFSQTASGEVHPFLWDKGVMTDLGALEGGVVRSSFALAINARSQVVGYGVGPNNGHFAEHAILWENGTITDLHPVPGVNSVATDINASGTIVGWIQPLVPGAGSQAVMWKNGVMTQLGTLGGSGSIANGINAAGEIVGFSTTSTGENHPFIWRNGVMTDLGFPGEAYKISDAGDVVGIQRAGIDDNGRAFVWSNGLLTDLSDGMQSAANDLNASGQVVGSINAVSGAAHAVIWIDGSPMTLSPDAADVTTASAINNAGLIAGSVLPATSPSRPVLWRPEGQVE